MLPRSETKTISTSQFCVQLYLDYFNKRLKVTNYSGCLDKMLVNIQDLIDDKRFTKIIIHSKQKDIIKFLSEGYSFEAIFSGFFNGSDNYVLAFYKTNERRSSVNWVKEDQIIKDVVSKGRDYQLSAVPSAYHFRRANVRDARQLAELYAKVFDVYPTPMNDWNYVSKVLEGDTIFFIVETEHKIVSAASADIDREFGNAELTDCATLPEHRKYGLIKRLLIRLEDELRQEHIYNAYSIARALSFGMNAAFYQLNYSYRGRLINNCYIYDKLEDMNVWVKDLSKST
ncbi:putative beta-lysine N-acetyltransferase [Halalkalibacter akibai]|nr:putative beta-lysine N-acetyltransferase [Halalkalibacter akibai]